MATATTAWTAGSATTSSGAVARRPADRGPDATGHGQTDNDLILGGAGNDTLGGGRERRPVRRSAKLLGPRRHGVRADTYGNDTLSGGRDSDVLYGQGGTDWLYGNDGQDELYGGTGDDTLFGGRDNDLLEGGDGPDP